MTENNQEGTFWFPEDKSRSFPATVVNEEEMIIEVNTAEESYFISQLIHGKGSILIHGEISDAKRVTTVVFEPNINARTDFVANTYKEILLFKIKWLFYDEHFPSTDINLKGLVVNFNGINKWITPSDILFSEKEGHRKIWNINIDNNYSLNFFYGTPITESDNPTVDNIGENVYFRIEPQNGERSFEELLEQKSIIQDFLNFAVTENIVLAQSIYGIIKKEDSEKLVKTKDRIHVDLKADKSKIRTPLLFHCREYGEDRLVDLIKKWFEFRSRHKFIYNFYVDSLYKSESVELSYFKSVAFLEGYHRDLLEAKDKSPMRRRKDLCFKSVLKMLEEADVEGGEIKVVKVFLNRPEIKQLTLGRRLKEIFEFYTELIALNTIAISFFKKDQLRRFVKDASVDEEANKKLSEVLEMKFAADCEKNRETRKKKYDDIMKLFQSKESTRLSLTFRMVLFVERLLTEQFPGTFAKYRNAMAHLLSKDYEANPNRWYYAFKIMQLTGQLCMLRMLGFEKKEVEGMFFMDKIDYESKLRVIIEANIQA